MTLTRIVAGLVPATAGAVSVFGKDVSAPVTDLGIVFQNPALLDWRDVLANGLFQVEIQGMSAAAHRARARSAAQGGTRGFIRPLSARIVGRHAAADCDRAGSPARPAASAHGRTVRHVRCVDPRADAYRPPSALAGVAQDGDLHHAFHRRGRSACRPGGRDVATAGTDRAHSRIQPAAAARSDGASRAP